MSANIYLVIIMGLLGGGYLLELIVEILNIHNASSTLPEEFAGYADIEKYRQSQEYLRENTVFELFVGGVTTLAMIIFILCGGFNAIDQFARHWKFGSIVTGLIFAGILAMLAECFRIPVSAYHTFVIEEKYGFNRTTHKTFLTDLLKGWGLTFLIGGSVLAAILWLFSIFGEKAWLYCWGFVTGLQMFLFFVAPVWIMPLFNKFKPLDEGELKNAIEDYARKEDFKMKGLYTMDGSRRSTKANAFFSGFGRFRRIVLFDTLIAKQSMEELVSILAHEMGHYQKKHVWKQMFISIASTGLMFFIFSFFINNRELFQAFGMENLSLYASLFFFGFLYSPLSMLISIGGNTLSRRYEYESDAYAVTTYGKPDAMINALKKLSVDNLSNLTPHALKVFLEYSHPPVLKRIAAIRRLQS